MTKPSVNKLSKIVSLVAAVIVLYGAALEFYNIAWGTGAWLGEFSLRWGIALVLFAIVCIGLLIAWGVLVWRGMDPRDSGLIPGWRGTLRWPLGMCVVALPIGLLQYSAWGVVLSGPFLRLLLWAICVGALSVLIALDLGRPWTRPNLLLGILISGSAFVVAAAFTEVTAYPFSLGWSEGNRLWDYSLLFGSGLYSFDPEHPPTAYLDFGRQLIGGLPFLLPRVSILGERLWLAFVATAPYLLLGLVTFWPGRRSARATWMLPALFGFVFLSQGPIHAPLLLCAMLVALACRLPMWPAVASVAISGYFAETSRFTWMFAPSMWAVMLEFGTTDPGNGGIPGNTWRRAIALALAGLIGSAMAYSGVLSWSATSVGSTAAVSTSQALLWYRLLPNATYGDGVLLGLAKAVVPLVVFLIYAGVRFWRPRRIQSLVIIISLAAFMVVGLIISTKIGGGGDLHNLDMLMIGLVFATASVWKAAGERWLAELSRLPSWVNALMVLLLAIPAYGPLMSLRPLSFAQDVNWLSVLADAERPRDLGSLPSEGVVRENLQELRQAVKEADRDGPVLFMDQRQLLTFGYVRDLDIISEYEKKRMMDEALSDNASYFEPFYHDLASRRFALLISSPLHTPIKDSEYGFGEENNAWVNWVARPILCYYEERNTLDEVKVELLIPRTSPLDCSGVLSQAAE